MGLWCADWLESWLSPERVTPCHRDCLGHGHGPDASFVAAAEGVLEGGEVVEAAGHSPGHTGQRQRVEAGEGLRESCGVGQSFKSSALAHLHAITDNAKD